MDGSTGETQPVDQQPARSDNDLDPKVVRRRRTLAAGAGVALLSSVVGVTTGAAGLSAYPGRLKAWIVVLTMLGVVSLILWERWAELGAPGRPRLLSRLVYAVTAVTSLLFIGLLASVLFGWPVDPADSRVTGSTLRPQPGRG